MKRPVVAIIGDSGTGKSSSLETLDPSRTCILNAENKALPMRNFLDFNNIPILEYKKLINALDTLAKPEMEEKYDNVILDSFTSMTEIVSRYCSKVYTGYDVWGNYNDMIVEVILKLKKLNQQVFIIALPEQKSETYGEKKSYARVKGKELKYGFLEKELAIVLFTSPIYDEDTGEMLDVEMDFRPNKFNSSKAPRGLFEAKPKNDAQSISDAILKYYKGEEDVRTK